MATEPKSVSLLASCALAANRAGACMWCGDALPKRRRTWCSERCANAFWTNHWWSLARRAAKRRDKYRCVVCQSPAPKRPSRPKCATETAYKLAMRQWRALKKTQRLEVNHIEAAQGRHRSLSCIHHLENLETMCSACHKRVTGEQARARAAATARVDRSK